jgi:hypothetical protein
MPVNRKSEDESSYKLCVNMHLNNLYTGSLGRGPFTHSNKFVMLISNEVGDLIFKFDLVIRYQTHGV